MIETRAVAASHPAIREVAAAAEALADVLEAENQALAARDWRAVGRLAAAKRAAGTAYESALASLASTGPLPADVRRRLRPLTDRLNRAAEDNERRLALLLFAQRRVIEAIGEAVASLNVAGYARSGGRVAAGPAAALSFDRAC
jgi:hypothetical protein